MPLRPFPFALNLGADICSIPRIKCQLAKRRTRFPRRLLTPAEIYHFLLRHPLYLTSGDKLSEHTLNQAAQYLAGRWAAKEAVVKALSPRRLSLRDVEIRRSERSAKPFAAVNDVSGVHWSADAYERAEAAARQTLEQNQDNGANSYRHSGTIDSTEEYSHDRGDGQIIPVTISHENEFALAIALGGSTNAEDFEVDRFKN